MLDDAWSRGFEDHERDQMWLIGIGLWAHAASALEAAEPAAILHEMLAPWSGQIPDAVAAVIEPIDELLGELEVVLGRVDDAIAHFEAAEELGRRCGCPFFVARALLERARLDAEHDPDAARARVAEALTIATDHGFARLEREAANRLAAG